METVERSRGEYRSLFWPVVLISVGVVWLLSNLGLISAMNFAVLLRLWPVLLILIGLDLLVGRRSPFLGGLIGVGAVVLLVALVIFAPSLGLTPRLEMKSSEFNAPVGAATSADINLSFSLGNTQVSALSGSNDLIDATITHLGEIEFQSSGDAHKTIRLRQREDDFGGDWLMPFNQGDQLRWDIGLSPNVPLSLDVNGGLGEINLQLDQLQLTKLDLNGGAGSITVALPATSAAYHADINGGLGEIRVGVAPGADVGVTINGGAGSVNLDIGEGADVRANINGGLGEVTVDVPAGAAVRINSRGGLGGVHLPAGYTKVSGDDNDGVWESPDFSRAEVKIAIDYNGGAGGLTVR